MKRIRKVPGHRFRPWTWPLSEAARDLRESVVNPLLWFVVATAILLLLCGGSDALNVRQMLDRTSAYRQAGGDMMIIESPGNISGTACDNLSTIAGVRSAIALRVAGPVTALALPDAPYVAYETSADPTVIFDVNGRSGMVIARKIADQLGLGVGDELHMGNGGDAVVTGIYDWPNDGRQPQYASVVLIDVPTTERDSMFDSCWVRAWPMSEAMRDALAATVADFDMTAPGATNMPVPTNLNPMLSAPPSADDYADRPSRFAPCVAMLLLAAVGASAVRIRRVELAMERHFGANVAQIALHIMTTAVGWLLPACLVSGGLIALVLAPVADGMMDAFLIWIDVVLRGLVAGVCGAMLGVIAAAATIRADSLPRLVRER
ncbi:hypothetical protein JS533_008390 [Bifidobacterium amazonense]|uniref:ABC transporter permease n=1 Tax=Bifidobacterium amazonense TaxID=2809027 RepID=A0ABS9VVZ4_9BIFI|nr:hypothetical protein [Bifidobacterium amazonense]MCH9276284.1 hypothetical protein [Bifidobacterium amazonense]